MPLVVLALVAAMIVFDAVHEVHGIRRLEAAEREARTLGADMLVVRNALEAYVRANPSTSGEVALGVLGLPGWFQPRTGIKTYVEGGRAFVYYQAEAHENKPALASSLSTGPSALMGSAHDARLVSPHTLTNITLPPGIPPDSLVLMY